MKIVRICNGVEDKNVSDLGYLSLELVLFIKQYGYYSKKKL